MRFLSLILAAAISLAPAVLAEDHVVVLGQDNTFTFTPDQIFTVAGDTITFMIVTRNREFARLVAFVLSDSRPH
jgi:plastocyanin